MTTNTNTKNFIDVDNFKMNTIEEAINDLKAGKLIVVMDDEERENEGDLVGSAELCTPETINFMATNGKGLICSPISFEIAQKLELEMMVANNTSLHTTGFTVSVDYLIGTTTGISTADRAKTVRSLANPNTKPTELGRPGHIFPLIAVKEGVLRRAGHTEAVVDLMKLAGMTQVGVLCEVINEDGTMARKPDLIPFAQKHNLKIITVKELIAYRLARENFVKCVAKAKLPTVFGDFTLLGFQNFVDGLEHIALIQGEIDYNNITSENIIDENAASEISSVTAEGFADGSATTEAGHQKIKLFNQEEPILVRVHSECLTGDVFGSLRCDCGSQLHIAMDIVNKAGCGVILYMRQEGRGIGLLNKLKAYQLQDKGMDTVEANVALGFAPDPRDYGIGAQILRSLGIKRMKLITNNPTKRVGLESYGLEVSELVKLELPPNEHNEFYLKTKKDKMGHILDKV